MTISGIAIAAMSSGQRSAKFHARTRLTAKTKTIGNAMDEVMEASETYRHIKTIGTHIANAAAAQIVK